MTPLLNGRWFLNRNHGSFASVDCPARTIKSFIDTLVAYFQQDAYSSPVEARYK